MKKRAAGSVTFFYACITLMLISLLGTVMESVRVHTARSMLSDSACLALQNSLAGFQRELWEDYHIFFLDRREAGGTEGLKQELQDNLSFSWQEGLLTGNRDWMGVSCLVEEVGTGRSMVEKGGEALKEQITAYMKYRAVTGAAEQLLEQLELVQGLKQGKSLFEKKLKLEENLAGIEKKRLQILRQLEEMEEVWARTDAVLESIQEKQQAAENGPDILAELDELYRIASGLSGQSGDVHSECSGYISQSQNAEKQKQEYEDWLEERQGDLEENAWKALREDLTELEESQKEGRRYVNALEQKLTQNQAVLQELRELCLNGMEEPDTITAERLRQLTGRYQSRLLPEDYELPAGGNSGKEAGPLEQLREYASKGVLSLVLPAGSQVSECAMDPALWQTEGEPPEEKMTEYLLEAEYEREHFGCYGKVQQETVLQYEREYLLIGSSSDRENLAGTVAELLLIRTTADFLQLLTDADKTAEARRLAAAIAGVTGSSALTPVIRTGILLLWSVEAAVEEVRELMKGGKVFLYEKLCAWKLDYEGYLSLLLLTGHQNRYLRMARLIEGNIQKRYQTAFQASDCISEIRMTVTAEIVPKFLGRKRWKTEGEYRLGYVQ